MTSHYKPADRDKAVAAYVSGMSVREVGRALGYPIGTVSRWVRLEGVARPAMQAAATDAERREAVRLNRDDGWSVTRIARKLGRAPSTVQNWLAAHARRDRPGVKPNVFVETATDRAAREARERLSHFIPMPLREGGWYVQGWWG